MSPPTVVIGEQLSHAPAEQRVIVHSVSWTTYEHLLADLANQSSTRLTYDRGILEIMCPLPEHEEYNRTITLLVEVLAEEIRIEEISPAAHSISSPSTRRLGCQRSGAMMDID